MKNLKRVLSLGLASVMLLGMMVVGAGAADFTDADDIEHQEAVDVLVALNVVKGKEDGSYFDPKSTVTRAEMAKMIAITMQGGTDVNTGVKAVPSYTDIKDHWAEQYIEYCTDLGIISGRGDGTFDPEGNVTAIEVTKMVLTAMGYDAAAYKLTGASWASRTDEEARKVSPRSLYEELSGSVVMNQPATRDTAAQLLWNGLQSQVVTVSPKSDQVSTGLEWQYTTGGDNPTLLYQRYTGQIWIGTMTGNYDTGSSGAEDGEITVNGHIEDDGKLKNAHYDASGSYIPGWSDASFPSDLSITNIGEEIKVIFKDGTNDKKNQPDKKDTIYGVFNTGATTVYKCVMDDVDKVDQGNSKFDKIEIDDINRDVYTGGVTVIVDYDEDDYTNKNASFSGEKAGLNLANYLSSSSNFSKGDKMKFVCNDDNKIDAVYVEQYKIAKITAVSATTVSVDGVGSINIDENEIYEGVEKDDVVTYSKWYDDDKDDAYFVVALADTVDGELTGYNYSGSNTSKVVVDGKGYSVHGTLRDVTDDSAGPGEINDDNIGDDVVVYLINGFAGAVDIPETTTSNYAVVTGYNNVAVSGDVGEGSHVDAAYDAMNVKILMSDGTEAKYDVHKDSTFTELKYTDTTSEPGKTYTVTQKIKTNRSSGSDFASGGWAEADDSTVLFAATEAVSGTLIKYSMNSGDVKIKDIAIGKASFVDGNGDPTDTMTKTDFKAVLNSGSNAATATIGSEHGGAFQMSGGADVVLWNKDTKSLRLNAAGTSWGVASTDAVLFVHAVNNDKYYTYNLRTLGNIKLKAQTKPYTVQYFTNNDGLVVAAYVELPTRPGTNNADTLYGLVAKVDEIYQPNGDTYRKYRVWCGGEDRVTIYVEDGSGLKKGDIIRFDEASDALYDIEDIDIVGRMGYPGYDASAAAVVTTGSYGFNPVGAVVANAQHNGVLAVAVDSYNSGKGILTYFTTTVPVANSVQAWKTIEVNGVSKTIPAAYKGLESTKGTLTVADDVVVVSVDAYDWDKMPTDNSIDSFNTATGYANAILFLDDDGVVEAVIVESSDKISLKGDTMPLVNGSVAPTSATVSAPTGAEVSGTAICLPASTASVTFTPTTITSGAEVSVSTGTVNTSTNAVTVTGLRNGDKVSVTVTVRDTAESMPASTTYTISVDKAVKASDVAASANGSSATSSANAAEVDTTASNVVTFSKGDDDVLVWADNYNGNYVNGDSGKYALFDYSAGGYAYTDPNGVFAEGSDVEAVKILKLEVPNTVTPSDTITVNKYKTSDPDDETPTTSTGAFMDGDGVFYFQLSVPSDLTYISIAKSSDTYWFKIKQ